MTLVDSATNTPGCERDRVVVIGHRGIGPGTRTLFGAARSEDTIGAFTAAMRAGADGFETDFLPTADDQVVSHHDATLTRMTDGTGGISTQDRRRRRAPPQPEPRTRADVPRGPARHGAGVPGCAPAAGVQGRAAVQRQLPARAGPARPGVRGRRRCTGVRDLFRAEHPGALSRAGSGPSGRLDRADPGPTATVNRSRLGRRDPRSSSVPPTPRTSDGLRPAGTEVSVRKVDAVAELHGAVRMGATRIVTDRPEVLGGSC